MKKKVLHFIHGLTMGGAETLVKEYCLKLDKEKFDISVLCFYKYHVPYEKQLEEAGIRITYIDDIENYPEDGAMKYIRKIMLLLKRVFYVRKYIRTEKPDVIHTHLSNNTYILFARPEKGTKIFHTVHSEPEAYWDGSTGGNIDFWASKQLVKKYQMRFIALHELMREKINRMFSVNDTLILNNGIDFARFDRALPKDEVRKRENIPSDAFVVGHVGRFDENKNHSFLIGIFAEIYQQNPKAYLLMIGNGETLPEIEEKLTKAGLEDHSKILSYRTDVPDLLNAMDCFVFPSIYEGLGIVLIEAQKMKLPCFAASSVPKAAEISNLVKWIDLDKSAKAWAEEINQFTVEKIQYHGLEEWDMNYVIKSLEKIYEGCERG